MAKKVITTTEYTDDLDGSKAEGTISFTFEGQGYEIDLSKKNAAALVKILKPYTDAARKVRGTAGRKPAAAKGNKRTDLSDIRSWAKSNGWPDLADRGRVPQAVIEAYDVK